MIRALILLATLAFGLGAAAQTPLSDLPLGEASAFDDDHLIATAARSPGEDIADRAEELAAATGLEIVAIWPLAALDVTCFVFRTTGDVEAAAAQLAAIDGVLEAYPVNSFSTQTAPSYKGEMLSVQDSLRAMRALAAHEATTGAGVRVALIDTGVSEAHRDLSEKVTRRNFVSRAASPPEGERHGTAMAAIIAADARNGVGMVGVAPDAELMALRACWEDADGRGRCNTFSLARALNFAILNGADVINLSLAGPDDPILRALIAAALRRDVAVVAAYPAPDGSPLVSSTPGVVMVSDMSARRGYVLAPGFEVFSAKPVDDFDFFSGVSVSTAHVAGATALILSASAGMTVGELTATLMTSSSYGASTLDICVALGTLGVAPEAC